MFTGNNAIDACFVWVLIVFGYAAIKAIYWAMEGDIVERMKAVLTVGACLLYLIFPFDLIPDVLFPVGYADDLVALVIAIKTGMAASKH